jgi:hypothetical protein
MNKFIKIFVTLLIFTQCKSIGNSVKITQREVSNHIIIRTASNNDNRIITVQFPKEIVLTNNSLIGREFIAINYEYNNTPSNRNLNLGLFTNENGVLKRIRNNKKKILPSKESLNFIFYSRHFVDSTKSTQLQFKPYLEKMLIENKDTLHIGTVSEFKTKHKELFKKLTNKDSISIQFLDNGKLGERINIPIEW